MSTLSSLRSQLASLERQLRDCKNERDREKEKRDKAKKRIDDVKPILSDLRNDFDNNCRGINKKNNGLESDIEAAVKGVDNIKNLASIISADVEFEPERDGYLSEVVMNLDEELKELKEYYEERKRIIQRLNNRIGELNGAIARIKWEIYQEELKEALEKAKDKVGL